MEAGDQRAIGPIVALDQIGNGPLHAVRLEIDVDMELRIGGKELVETRDAYIAATQRVGLVGREGPGGIQAADVVPTTSRKPGRRRW